MYPGVLLPHHSGWFLIRWGARADRCFSSVFNQFGVWSKRYRWKALIERERSYPPPSLSLHLHFENLAKQHWFLEIFTWSYIISSSQYSTHAVVHMTTQLIMLIVGDFRKIIPARLDTTGSSFDPWNQTNCWSFTAGLRYGWECMSAIYHNILPNPTHASSLSLLAWKSLQSS